MQALFSWPARRDSNPRPSESESAAISSFATGGCANIIAQKKAGSKSGGRAAQKYFSDGQQNWKKLLQKSEVSLIIYELLIFSATVAQLVEQLIRNQQVAGSSPASSSRKGTCFCRCFFFFILPVVLYFDKNKNSLCQRQRLFMERMTRLELATSTLARWRSTG